MDTNPNHRHWARRIVTALTITLILPGSIRAGDTPPSCVAEAEARLKPREYVQLVFDGDRRIQGYFRAIDLRRTSIALVAAKSDASPAINHDITGIRAITYRRRGHITSEGLFFGAMLGTFAGIAVAEATSDDSESSGVIQMDPKQAGALVGAAAGLVIGMAASLALPSTRTLKCN